MSSPEDRPTDGGMAARRAVVRWAWRLFRREWRQQLLVLALLIVAVATTVLASTVATDTPPPANAGFGTAEDMATFGGVVPHLSAQIAALEHRFGRVEVIESKTLQVPGSVNTYDLEAKSPNGPFGGPMLSLISGQYPTSGTQVAVTPGVGSDFHLKIGDVWRQGGGVARRVVGIVENPQSLLDEFALVLPGQVKSPDTVKVLFDAPGVNPSSIGPNVTTPASVANTNVINPETLSLAVLTIGMILIALMTVGGFTVLAQRRLRSLGMLASIGATDKHVSLVVRANGVVVGVVGALTGVVLGLVLWLAYRPHFEQSVHHLVGVLALQWVVVAAAIVLAVVATYWAASRPARAITRLPVMSALSGRPAPPRQVHRSAIPGLVFLVVAFLLLGYAGAEAGSNGGGGAELVLGIVALIPAVILLSPFFLAGFGRLARRTPVAVRLALRDLSRYRARSSSTLAAVSIGVMISVIVATLAQARYSDIWDPAGPNVASNQALIWAPGPQSPTPRQLAAMGKTAVRVGAALGATHVGQLEQPNVSLQNLAGTKYFNPSIFVATPQLLRVLGIPPSEVDPKADVLTSESGLGTGAGAALSWCVHQTPQPGPQGQIQKGNFACTRSAEIKNPLIQQLGALPTGVHAPNTLITEHALRNVDRSIVGGSGSVSTVGWFVEAPQTITSTEIQSAQGIAATSGLSLETQNDEPTSGEVVDWATAFGVFLALCILAMSVGLIRSETAGDLRTLAATGASSYTRRTLTAATAGALGLLGAILGTFAGYIAVIGWLRDSSLQGGLSALGNVPVANLLVILLAMPAVAAGAGWLLAGRQPPAMAHQPIE
ncbi:MAG: FtsX-like permease family protein [Acidimicrobiales bacterium]|jgi:putative ABC transport system permease protein